MKIRKVYILGLLFGAFCLGACSDDEVHTGISGEEAQPFLGVYKGKMDVKVQDVDATNMWQQIKVEYEGDELQMGMEAFRIDDLELGDIWFDQIETEKQGEALKFSAMTNQALTGINNANIRVEGNIQGKSMQVDFTIQSVSTPVVYASMLAQKRDRVEQDTAALVRLWFDDERVVMQPDIPETSNSITFYVADTIADTTQVALIPRFELTEGSTVSFVPGEEVVFSDGTVKVVVWAEDSIHRRVYSLNMDKAQSHRYPLDEWQTWPRNETNPELTYLTPTDESWQTNNEWFRGMKQEGAYGMSAAFPVEKVEDNVVAGAAVKITSHYVEEDELFPGLHSGMFYMGDEFMLDEEYPMKSTPFGVMFETRPLKVKGNYRYRPGSPYYMGGTVDQTGMTDTCRIIALLYEVNNETETLDSVNIFNDDKVIAYGIFDGATTEGEDYIPFDVKINYIKSYYFTKKYKLAVICMSSRYGYRQEGADGSTLWVDELEVISQKKKEE